MAECNFNTLISSIEYPGPLSFVTASRGDSYAWHYKYYQKDQTKLDRMLYSSAEIEARKKTIGIWSVPAVPPWDFRRK